MPPLDDSFYSPPITTLADAQAMAIEQINAILERVRDLGVIVDDLLPSPPASPVTFATDAASASGIWDTFVALETGGLTDTWWRSVEDDWYEMQPSATDEFAGQAACCVAQYVAACNDNAKALRDAIDACATIDEVLETDLSAGWPSRTCATVTLPTFGGGDCCLTTEEAGGSTVTMTNADEWYTFNDITFSETGEYLLLGQVEVVDQFGAALRVHVRIAEDEGGGSYNPTTTVISDWPAGSIGSTTYATVSVHHIADITSGDTYVLQAMSSVAGCEISVSPASRFSAVKLCDTIPPPI